MNARPPRPSLALLPMLVLMALLATPAQAECYADYKAKQDAPLRLAYGVAKVPDAACDVRSATAELAPRLAAAGWTLLNVIATFGPEGLAQRESSAAGHFLRY